MSNKAFIDTAGWANLFIATEPYYQNAVDWFTQARQQRVEMFTTNYIILELIALFNSPLRIPRPTLLEYVDGIKTAPYLHIIHINEAVDESALLLLKQRNDKNWSLVDASSFIIMQQYGMTEALTSDKHFEQAGFIRLL